ncbi:MAG: flagellar basal body rod protein FlgF [Gammaproteobacteria bacterium]|nr:flagellar basal body rod protein FlgF [Gammaproteobacteria bacterium]
MTDKAVYIGMTGAKASMHQLEILTNNLANINTTGFRGDYETFKQSPATTNAKESRVFSSIGGTFTDFEHGPVLNTGRDLDVAVSGDGFIAVQSKTGKEGYTRAGSLQLNNGDLLNGAGDFVMGNGGIIHIPPAEKLDIAADGTVSARLKGTTEMVVIDRIKLVTPATSNLEKGVDGLFYTKDGNRVPTDEKIRLIHGALEGSNVNAVDTLTKLIDLSRNFEVHTNVMKTMQEDSDRANQILALPR